MSLCLPCFVFGFVLPLIFYSSHPEDVDEEMEDDDGSEPAPPPPMPQMPRRFRSGQ